MLSIDLIKQCFKKPKNIYSKSRRLDFKFHSSPDLQSQLPVRLLVWT